MQAKKAAAIKEEWGDKPCDHPAMAKEYAEGKRTGDYVCTQCGAKVTFRERAEILAARRT
jgi:DNA-directed RNA polymerase subunit RPC12/RpoP